MVVGVCEIALQVPGAESLKDKRRVLQSVIARLRNEFNVSVAEVDQQDTWQLATIGLACVATSDEYARGLLERAVRAVEESRLDVVVLDWQVELL